MCEENIRRYRYPFLFFILILVSIVSFTTYEHVRQIKQGSAVLLAAEGKESRSCSATQTPLSRTASPPPWAPTLAAAPDGLAPCPVGARVSGFWVDFGERSATADPPCCTWDGRPNRQLSTLHLPEPACNLSHLYYRGDWAAGFANALAPAGGGGCACDAERARAVARPEWMPTGCKLPAWDAHAFCSALAGRRILFIGDSISQQVAAAIHNFIVWGGGDCAVQLAHTEGDTLTGRPYGKRNLGCAWLDCVTNARYRPDIVILGAGPHVENDEGMADIVRTVRSQFLELPRSLELSLIWRTSLGGGCSRRGQPMWPRTVMPQDEAGYWAALDAEQNVYNYKNMERWDALAIEDWRGVPNTAVLDLTPLWLRPDAMVSSGSDAPTNCVHVCSPGPLRFAARQLAHVLLHALPPPPLNRTGQ